MGLQKKLGQLAASLELLERKERFLLDVLAEAGRLMAAAADRCRNRGPATSGQAAPDCSCEACEHAYARFAAFNHGLRALLDEEAALVARFGGRPVLPLTRQ